MWSRLPAVELSTADDLGERAILGDIQRDCVPAPVTTECSFRNESVDPVPANPTSCTPQSRAANCRKVKRAAKGVIDNRGKDFLTESEMKLFLDASKRGRHGVRDYTMILMTYRHGLRVSELVDLRLRDI